MVNPTGHVCAASPVSTFWTLSASPHYPATTIGRC